MLRLWLHLAGIWHCTHFLLMGHCAAEITMNHWKDLAVLLLNPMAVWFFTCPAHSSPMDHADHHMSFRCART
jgi:hypothetical protein